MSHYRRWVSVFIVVAAVIAACVLIPSNVSSSWQRQQQPLHHSGNTSLGTDATSTTEIVAHPPDHLLATPSHTPNTDKSLQQQSSSHIVLPLPAHNALHFDIVCNHRVPHDGSCLTPNCDVRYLRASQRACASVSSFQGQHEEGRREQQLRRQELCPCHRKRLAHVQDVYIIAIAVPNASTTIVEQMIAFTTGPQVWERTKPSTTTSSLDSSSTSSPSQNSFHSTLPAAAAASERSTSTDVNDSSGVTQQVELYREDAGSSQFHESSSQHKHTAGNTTPPLALIDAASAEFSALSCTYGIRVLKGKRRVISAAAAALRTFLQTSNPNKVARTSTAGSVMTKRKKSPGKMEVSEQPTRTSVEEEGNPWSCASLSSRHPTTIVVPTSPQYGIYNDPVFYALDSSISSPGHSMDMIMFALGQYVASGLDRLRVPWLVPCSSRRRISSGGGGRGAPIVGGAAVAPLPWTRFFIEANEALQHPMILIDIAELELLRHHHLHQGGGGETTKGSQGSHDEGGSLVFSSFPAFRSVYFPAYYLGWNQWCFKGVLRQTLWPHVASAAVQQSWDAAAWNKFMAAYITEPPTTSLQVQQKMSPTTTTATTQVSATNAGGAFNKSIMFIKVRLDVAAYRNTASPGRAFLYSSRFFDLIHSKRILALDPTMHVLQRMWHVNTASLVVATWGSTLATAMGLMMNPNHHQQRFVPKEHRHNDNDDDTEMMQQQQHNSNRNNNYSTEVLVEARHHRLLVLIHPGYCLEAARLLKSRKSACSHVALRGPSRYVQGQLTVQDGFLVDYDGGPNFCAKFVVVGSLRYVRPTDFEFPCQPPQTSKKEKQRT